LFDNIFRVQIKNFQEVYTVEGHDFAPKQLL